MSAILKRKTIGLREEPTTLREPKPRPQKQRSRRSKRERQTSVLAVCIGYCAKVAVLSFVFVCVSSAVCQYLFEQARHSGIAANSRASAAERSVTGLRRDIDRLQSTERVATWAALNGFTASYLASNEKAE